MRKLILITLIAFDEYFNSSVFTTTRWKLRRRAALLTRFGTPVDQARGNTWARHNRPNTNLCSIKKQQHRLGLNSLRHC